MKHPIVPLIKSSLFCWLELQISVLLSFLPTFLVTILRFFSIDPLVEDILILFIEIVAVNLFVFFLFAKGLADEADSFRGYLLPVMIAFVLHLIIGLIPLVTSVGMSARSLFVLMSNGFSAPIGITEVSYGERWCMFALLCLPKLASALSAYPYRKYRDQKKHKR